MNEVFEKQVEDWIHMVHLYGFQGRPPQSLGQIMQLAFRNQHEATFGHTKKFWTKVLQRVHALMVAEKLSSE